MEVQDSCEGQISKTWFVNFMWIKISYRTLLFNGCNWCRVSNGSPLGKWISELKYIFFFLYRKMWLQESSWAFELVISATWDWNAFLLIMFSIYPSLPTRFGRFFLFRLILVCYCYSAHVFPAKRKRKWLLRKPKRVLKYIMTNYEFATGNIIKKKSINILIKERERLKRHSQTYHVVPQSDIFYKSF